MKRVAVVLLTAVVGIASAHAQTPNTVTFPLGKNGDVTFVMPSFNVECNFTPAGGTDVYRTVDGLAELSCDRMEPTYVRAVLTAKSAHKFTDVGDRSCCGVENVLPYGSRWSHASFVCDSTQQGLTCTGPGGHSIAISRTNVTTR